MTLHDMGDVFEYTALDSYEKKKKKVTYFVCIQCSEVCWLNNEALRMQRHEL